MVERHSILVVIDPTSEVQPAFAKAAGFAKLIDADLALFSCIFNPDYAHVEWMIGNNLKHLRDAEIDRQYQALEQLAEPLRSAGRSVSIKVAWDKPLHEAIVREALEISPDFVVKDADHHSAISRILFTNTDWHLIRECPFPLWIVKSAAAPNHAAVMAAVDPTHEHDQTAALDSRIIRTAELLSVMFESQLHLVHIFEPPPLAVIGDVPTATAAAPIQDLLEQAREVHVNALQTLAADGGFPAEQVHLREGDQVRLLPETASELNAGIVVMGAITRSPLQRVIIGHTAEKTLDRFQCDVVIVKPDDFKSPVAAIPPIYGYIEKEGLT